MPQSDPKVVERDLAVSIVKETLLQTGHEPNAEIPQDLLRNIQMRINDYIRGRLGLAGTADQDFFLTSES